MASSRTMPIVHINGTVLFEMETPQSTPRNGAFIATMEEAVRQGIDLSGADLFMEWLRGANLRGAKLRGAFLAGAYIQDTDFTGADLRDADLRISEYKEAILTNAKLRGSKRRGKDTDIEPPWPSTEDALRQRVTELEEQLKNKT